MLPRLKVAADTGDSVRAQGRQTQEEARFCSHLYRTSYTPFFQLRNTPNILYYSHAYIETILEERISMGLHIHLHTFPTLETERLVLRQLAAPDAQDSFLFLSDEEN